MKIRQCILSLFCLLFCLSSLTAQSIQQDSLALVEFYNANNGAVEWELENWLSDAPLSEWEGLTVEGDSSVTKFAIRHDPIRSLRHLGQLPYLREANLALTWLNFPENDSVYFATEFAGLQNIERLIWTGANFRTNLRLFEISKLKGLKYLDLSGSTLWKDPMLDLQRLSQLTNLEELRLSRCKLTGSLPDELANLEELEALMLQDNAFSGALPQAFSQLENLQTLNIAGNNFTELPFIPGITDLDVSENELTFSSLVPYVGISNFSYSAQSKIDVEKIIYFDSDTSFTLKALNDAEDLQFQWYRNGELISDFSELEFQNPTQANDGVYYYEISHPDLPELTLESYPVFLCFKQSGYTFSPDSIYFEDDVDTYQTISMQNTGAGTLIIEKFTSVEPYGWWGEIEINSQNEPCPTEECNYEFTLFGNFTLYNNNIGYILVPPNAEMYIHFRIPDLCPICKTTNQTRSFEDTLTVVFKNPDVPPFKIFASGQGIASSVQSENEEPIESFSLSQNYPNPFNPETTIKFSTPNSGFVRLEIYNILGESVRKLLAKEMTPGEYTIVWDSKNELGQAVASGVYIYKLQAGGFTASQKMVLLR